MTGRNCAVRAGSRGEDLNPGDAAANTPWMRTAVGLVRIGCPPAQTETGHASGVTPPTPSESLRSDSQGVPDPTTPALAAAWFGGELAKDAAEVSAVGRTELIE